MYGTGYAADIHSTRPETEYFTFRAADFVLGNVAEHNPRTAVRPFRVLDLCTGTGSISLLLHALLALHFPRISILGIDSSQEAVNLARKNLWHNMRLGLLRRSSVSEIKFRQGNVFSARGNDFLPMEESCTPDSTGQWGDSGYDILISNPPYISDASFKNGTTARSVRFFEPKTALVPPIGTPAEAHLHEDLFYHAIVPLSFKLPASLTVLECGDRWQALRVADLCKSMSGTRQASQSSIQIWSSGGGYDVPPSGAVYEPHAVVMQLA